jgi:hypothetical protein
MEENHGWPELSWREFSSWPVRVRNVTDFWREGLFFLIQWLTPPDSIIRLGEQ